MRLLVLGGGSGQLALIKKAKKMGYQVIVSDYYPDAPGKKIADFSAMSSSFDPEANLKTALKYQAEGVLTAGTDQPVYTAAFVAEKLNLNQYISPAAAEAVTNKKVMKKKFSQNQIATVKYKFLSRNFREEELANFKKPFVIKPLDSQGQRGVYKLASASEIREKFNKVLSFSRADQILLEEYYPADEITVSGWVKDGQAVILTVTDRLRFEVGIHIGICSAHRFPSKYLAKYRLEIKSLSQKIVDKFSIENGPFYFQFLIGAQGIKVNEVAARIGGAYEGDFMAQLTGVDILKLMVQLAAGKEIDYSNLDNYSLAENKKHLSVHLFYAAAGEIKKMSSVAEIKNLPGVLNCGFNYSPGEKIPAIEDATARAGFFIVLAAGKKELELKVAAVYNQLEIIDSSGINLIIENKLEEAELF